MSVLDLTRQLAQQLKIASRRIASLDIADPNRSWFELEFAKIDAQDLDDLSLEECNARLSALKQLTLLMRNHCVRLQNPNYADTDTDVQDSYLTVMARLPSNVLESTRDLGFSIEPELLHQHASENENFDPVSPTAKIVAFLRSLDRSLQIDGGFTPETEGDALLRDLGITDPVTQQSMAVLFQSRYHAINSLLSDVDRDVNQVVEFAAGISPRGYQWSSMSPGTIYLESDLPQLMVHKAKMIRNARLQQVHESLGIHHCCSADVLDSNSMSKAVHVLDTDAPFTIITEGLLLYFDQQEMNSFLSNIASLLHEFPQARWVTDFVTTANLQELFASHSGVASAVKRVFSMTGREVVPCNPFQTDDCVIQLLEKFHLNTITQRRLADLTPRLELDLVHPSQRRNIVGNRKIWNICGKALGRPS